MNDLIPYQSRLNERVYCYYNASGAEIGQSTGSQPDASLFNTAHYVIADQAVMLKNQDPIDVIENDIKEHTNRLINTPMRQMAEICYLNRLITALKQVLQQRQAS